MKESDELFLLRFRYGRTAEIFISYKVFLYDQVRTGQNYYCSDGAVVKQIRHTLLLTFYSFVYSLFDKSGTDFIDTTSPYENILTPDGKQVRAELIETWKANKTAISKLRHNIGFHGGRTKKGLNEGYGALADIHPQTPQFIMTLLNLFFIELDEVVEPTQSHVKKRSSESKTFMMREADKLREQLKDETYLSKMRDFKKLNQQSS